MSNTIPLPDSEYGLAFFDEGGMHDAQKSGYSASDMHAHAAAVSAAKDARIKVLEDALRKAIVQNEHDMLMTGEELRAARAALGDKT